MSSNITSWILSDGKAGDEQQCIAVAEALELQPEIRRVRPRAPYRWAMPWGPIDPTEGPDRESSPLAGPFPDLVLASGRRAVPYLRFVKKASRGRAYTVFLKDPRTGPKTADLIWVPEHDPLRGENVISTLTPPHRLSEARLAQERADPDPRLNSLPRPAIAVLVGGDSRHHHFTDADIDLFAGHLTRLAQSGAGLMMTASRRTPNRLREKLAALAHRSQGFFWDGTGENPYFAMLALAEAVVVTGDSFNMLGEAAATGRPLLVYEPSGGHPKLRRFRAGLEALGAVHPFTGRIVELPYKPLDSTPVIAKAVAEGLFRHRRMIEEGFFP